MAFPRACGVLLHPTSLPGGHGVGDFGPEAYRFLEFLTAGKQRIWQMLPLGPTGYGDSPYQTFSAFAGNPLLISLERLADDGLVERGELGVRRFREGVAAYESAISFKMPVLERAHARFEREATAAQRAEFQTFCAAQSAWLHDFALFMALKQAHELVAWPRWGRAYRDREPKALEEFAAKERAALDRVKFTQYLFFRQFHELRAEAKRRGISLMGDIPIYAAWDSADVWCAPRLWHLEEDGQPALQSGVPPDYFSATGQLWGNPVYRWEAMEREGYAWWVERFRATFEMFDLVRVDHFRGFQAFWAVPGRETTAVNGQWLPGPGARLFEAIEAKLGRLPVLAENLGVITPEVEAIRHRFGFPGMAVLQFAFGTDPQAPDFRPHNYPRDVVAYSGTHDNDTTVGWWSSAGADSTRSAEDVAAERAHALRYLGLESGREIHWEFVRALMASVANTVLFPAQDLLGLGSEARMNMPSTLGGNWLWRLHPGTLTGEIAERLAGLARLYDR
jgi:4-alpha-glucanotransferase